MGHILLQVSITNRVIFNYGCCVWHRKMHNKYLLNDCKLNEPDILFCQLFYQKKMTFFSSKLANYSVRNL